MDYIIDSELESFLKHIEKAWLELMLCSVGQIYSFADNINGVRFVDKTSFTTGKNIMFRLEIWVNNQMDNEKINEAKEYFKKQFGCPGIAVKNM